MKQRKAINFIEQLNINEMSVVKGGFVLFQQTGKNVEAQSSGESKIIYINGIPYRIQKNGSLKPA